jgi:hypothetical protein
MLETDRKLRNQNKLTEMHPVFRAKVAAVLQEMEKAGYRPRVQEAWRSPEDQMKAFRAGATRLQYGFHNVTAADGTKEALAADIIDDDRPDGVKLPYILHLAAAAKNNGLTTGVYFDLAPDKVVNLDKALAEENWSAPVHIGWDPLHVQVTGMTADEAKAGKRPSEPETGNGAGTSEEAGSAAGPGTGAAATGGSESASQPVSTARRYRVTDLDTNQSADYELSTAFKPVMLLAVPYVSQLGPGADVHRNDCGAACAAMLLRAYLGLALTPDEFYTKFAIPGDVYLTVLQVRNAMGSLGLLTDFRAGLSLQDVFNTIATGKPLVTLLRYRTLSAAGLTERPFEGPHFAVAVGMDCKNIYLHDPLYTDPAAGEAHAYPLDLFWQAWKDVANDPSLPNPERSAIIPTAGIGFRLARRARITAQALYVRSAPNVNSKIVATLRRNDIVEIQREMAGWGEIGTDRWISIAYTAQVAG